MKIFSCISVILILYSNTASMFEICDCCRKNSNQLEQNHKINDVCSSSYEEECSSNCCSEEHKNSSHKKSCGCVGECNCDELCTLLEKNNDGLTVVIEDYSKKPVQNIINYSDYNQNVFTIQCKTLKYGLEAEFKFSTIPLMVPLRV